MRTLVNVTIELCVLCKTDTFLNYVDGGLRSLRKSVYSGLYLSICNAIKSVQTAKGIFFTIVNNVIKPVIYNVLSKSL
jgi:hypothetical protein